MTGYLLRVRCPACTGEQAAIEAYYPGESRPRYAAHFPASTWLTPHEQYLAAAAQAVRFATFAKTERTIRTINRARRLFISSAVTIVRQFYAPLLSQLAGQRVYAMRCAELLGVPLAPSVAAAGDSQLALPLDLHPRLSFERAVLVAESDAWPCPRPAEICVLFGADLGERALLPEAKGALAVHDAAALVRWQMDRDAAFAVVRKANGRVLPLTLDNLCAAIEGQLGEHLQVLGHLESEHLLQCDDGELDVRGFLATVIEQGITSPLKSVDLSVCSSSDELSAVFHAVGVQFVSSIVGPIHIGQTSRSLRRLYEGGYLDGSTPFQHAWLERSLAPGVQSQTGWHDGSPSET